VSRAIDQTTVEAERSVKTEVDAFEQTVGDLLAHITRRREEVIEQMLRTHRDETLKLRRAKEQVVNLASKLNDTVSACQRALNTNSHVEIITGRVDMERQLCTSAPVVVPQVKPPMIHFARYQDIISGVDAITVGPGSRDALPTAVLEAHSIFQPRGFKFCKSTYNEVQLLNRGFSALSSGRTWETVMTDTVLSAGQHYFEVRLDRYDATNGHNVVIGLIFDGGFELCEVLGEDNNSVGFNCGRGSKCVGGDFMVPYGQPCGAGDVVGVKIDFSEGCVDIFRNGTPLGTAFTGLQRPCYAAVSLINAQQVTLMFPSKVPS
jgi:SPRY domain-containing SOCS box protein 3